MSIKAMTVVWESKIEDAHKKFILMYYADRGNDDGENIWPAVGTVAKKCSLSDRTVQRLTSEMVKCGILQFVGHNKNGTNQYRINLEMVANYVPAPNGGDTVSPGQPDGVTQCHRGGDTVSPGGCHGDTPRGVTVSPEPSINHQLTTKEPPLTRAAQKKGDQVDGMLHFATLARERKADGGDFPEDIRPLIEEFSGLWGIIPPNRSQGRRSEFADWIQGGRALLEACGEFGLACLRAVYADWQKDRPYTVTRPASLVRVARANAGEMRSKPTGKPIPGNYQQPGESDEEYRLRRAAMQAEWKRKTGGTNAAQGLS